MTITDFDILHMIYQGNHRTEINGLTITEIHEQTGYSIKRVRNGIKVLLDKRYVLKGATRGNSFSYYISHDGICKLNEIGKELNICEK